MIQSRSVSGVGGIIKSEIFDKKYDTLLLLIPAGLYTIQNYLMYFHYLLNNNRYVSLKLLNAATYQILTQGRIIVTAFFSICILKKTITLIQWISILILPIGMILVQPTSIL